MYHLKITRPEVWGGIESTINRVGDQYKDQLEYSGHYQRHGDIREFANLGISSIRYPVLWERHQKDKDSKITWDWTAGQLKAIRAAGLNPIVGFVHHGSGPPFTHLLDPGFPRLLAGYAYEVASHFPWVRDYTPVNEPLTTARFSGLYGHWFPHCKDENSFYRMLLNQLKGTVLAMKAIRAVNPNARLIQTEDLGKTHSTEFLGYQAEFENNRRWLTFDILTGLLKPGHVQYNNILDCGINEDDIAFFREHKMKPDILGLNYYITSERWLDEAVGKYPRDIHGGNGRHAYVDTEVVRANPSARAGFKKLGQEAWDRYEIPIAVTEAHLHCTREEQLRWFREIWDDACALSTAGVSVIAVTAWALLGSFDWDTLLTKTGTLYESGVFDIKTFPGQLRRTALAKLIQNIASNIFDWHPLLSEKGWWHPEDESDKYSDRNLVIIIETISNKNSNDNNPENLQRLFSDACRQRRIPYITVHRSNERRIWGAKPWAIINISGKETYLSRICADMGIQYVDFSGEEIEDGSLNICVEDLPMTIHQVHKVLDLLIDEETGLWVFDSRKTSFKSPELVVID